MKSLTLFARLAKVDEARREVWGVATAEMVDKEGEILDYESSKPYFKAWSDEISKATDGRSLGNVREMHEPSAVGKLIAIDFVDQEKEVRVGAKIIDDTAWQKCREGVYTGFSIGGAYVKAWKDGQYMRFTANPAEISVVDNPSVPGAHFTAVKADGQVEVRKFAASNTSVNKSGISKTGVNEAGASATGISKIGARHSAETKAHHAEIEKYVGVMAKAASDALEHLYALKKDDGGAETMVHAHVHKDSAATQPEINHGEQTMLDATEKIQLEKAHADSASALSKIAAVETSVTSLRTQMEQNNQEIQKSLTNLVGLLEKLVDPQSAAARVARTAPPAVSVTKEHDGSSRTAHATQPPTAHELLKSVLQKPLPASIYLR